MHSSRMRTVRSSSRFSWRGMSASVHAEIPTPRDHVPPGTMYPPGPCTPRDHAPPGTMHIPLPWDKTSPRTMHPLPQDHATPGTMHPPCGQTDTCKNITFATSLRTVIIAVLRTSTAQDLTVSRGDIFDFF